MNYIARAIEPSLIKAAKSFPCVVLTGPRRSGKTHLLKRLFPKAQYYLLEDPDVIEQEIQQLCASILLEWGAHRKGTNNAT